ncbi:MAG: hypothetical protein RLZZ385_2403 [Pseudomonadota bacterium]|jgi:hypothetical protein
MNRSHIVIALLLITTITSSALAWQRQNQHQRLEEQVAQYRRQAEQLLAQVETDTRARLDTEKQLAELQSRLLTVDTRAQAQAEELAAVRQQIDPDYADLERQLRERIGAELRREQQRAAVPTTAGLINELSALPQDERMALMAVQGQYGDFLNSLNADARRKEQIAQALVSLTMEQNQARTDLVNQPDIDPREMRQQIMAISSPEAVREALAFALTEEEMALFETFQQNQPNVFFSTSVGAPGGVRLRQGGRDRQGPDGQTGISSFEFVAPGQRLIIREAVPEDALPQP